MISVPFSTFYHHFFLTYSQSITLNEWVKNVYKVLKQKFDVSFMPLLLVSGLGQVTGPQYSSILSLTKCIADSIHLIVTLWDLK